MTSQPLHDVCHSYVDGLRRGDRRAALGAIKAAIKGGAPVQEIYLHVLGPAMYEVGRLWETHQFTVAEEHLATAITQSVMAQLQGGAGVKASNGRTVVAASVGGELHDLGIRMVADFFEMDGWDVYYLGGDVPSESIISMAGARSADLLALSITLSAHLPGLRELIAEVRRAPIGERIKVMVGGQPLLSSQATAASLGADFIAQDAREAIAGARRII
jgi:MerR family transcriptional regulator, light-induced transcriptional regulator